MSLSLFDDAPPSAHHVAFENWVSAQRATGALRQPSSIQVYRDMWGSFAAWCLAQSPPVTLESLDARDLQAFQSARYGVKSADLSLSPRHALRLLRLIDRVLHHHAAQSGAVVNPATAQWLMQRPDIRYADAVQSDPLPEFLTVSEARSLITFLSSARPRPAVAGPRRDAHLSLTWQQLRNRVSVALQLGGGLSPGDVRLLQITAPASRAGRGRDLPWKVAVPRNGSAPARETPIAPWAGELLEHWLTVRTQERIQGPFLFPSTRGGKPWSKESQYKAARVVLEEAGLKTLEGGSFKLRHTFALRQLRRGTPPDQVARWLGVELDAMEKYRRVVAAPAEVI